MKRSARRMQLCKHLHAAGPRPVLEALIAVQSGQDLDDVLEDFARIPASVYRALGIIYNSTNVKGNSSS
jgi:hypothetical protein